MRGLGPTVDGPAHGGRVETVVNEALADVDDLDVRRLLELAEVQDELVRASAVLSREQDLQDCTRVQWTQP